MDKKRERFYVERFLSIMNIVEFELKDSESPDFILKTPSADINLEPIRKLDMGTHIPKDESACEID